MISKHMRTFLGEAAYVSTPAPDGRPQENTQKISYCSSCGSKLDSIQAFCPECGNKIEQGRERTKGVSTESLPTNQKSEKLLTDDQIAKIVKETLTDDVIAKTVQVFKYGGKVPPEAQPIVDLNEKAWWVAAGIGFIYLILCFIAGYIWFGIIPLVVIICQMFLNFYIAKRLQFINELIIKGEYQQAKNNELILAVLGLIFGWVIVGVIILFVYFKYNELSNAMQ